MRQSKISSEEALVAELATDNRRITRAAGFAKMHERDRGYRLLSNGSMILWHVDKDAEGRALGAVMPNLPSDSFKLIINGKEHLFNTDEFRQSLRWA